MMASVAGPVVRASPTDISAMHTTMNVQYGESVRLVAAYPNPAAMKHIPACTTLVVPNRRISTIAIGAEPPVTIATGRVRSPASSGGQPRTACMYWVIMKMNPNKPKKAKQIAAAAAENRGLANSRTSSSG